LKFYTCLFFIDLLKLTAMGLGGVTKQT